MSSLPDPDPRGQPQPAKPRNCVSVRELTDAYLKLGIQEPCEPALTTTRRNLSLTAKFYGDRLMSLEQLLRHVILETAVPKPKKAAQEQEKQFDALEKKRGDGQHLPQGRRRRREQKKRLAAWEKLLPSVKDCYEAVIWAIQLNPALATAVAADRQLWDWLRAQENCPFALPPTLATFSTYLSVARRHHDTRKRILTHRSPAPEAENGGAP